MYQLKRITKTPNSPLRILIDQPADGDGGFGQGGDFYFEPAGQDGDTHSVAEHGARAIMEDASLAPHFTCSPDLPKRVAAPEQAAEPDSASGGKAKGKQGAGR